MENPQPSKKDKTVKNQSKFSSFWSWPIKILVLAIALSVFFSIVSEYVLGAASNQTVKLVVAIVVILVFIVIAIIADMIGVAITACDIEPFRSMAAKKVRGAKEAISLIKNNDKVASLCNDVIGDVCGILSGSACAVISTILILGSTANAVSIIVSALVSGLVAGLTIFGKALGKKFAINNCSSIILKVGKCLSIFSKKSKQKQDDDKPNND